MKFLFFILLTFFLCQHSKAQEPDLLAEEALQMKITLTLTQTQHNNYLQALRNAKSSIDSIQQLSLSVSEKQNLIKNVLLNKTSTVQNIFTSTQFDTYRTNKLARRQAILTRYPDLFIPNEFEQ